MDSSRTYVPQPSVSPSALSYTVRGEISNPFCDHFPLFSEPVTKAEIVTTILESAHDPWLRWGLLVGLPHHRRSISVHDRNVAETFPGG